MALVEFGNIALKDINTMTCDITFLVLKKGQEFCGPSTLVSPPIRHHQWFEKTKRNALLVNGHCWVEDLVLMKSARLPTFQTLSA